VDADRPSCIEGMVSLRTDPRELMEWWAATDPVSLNEVSHDELRDLCSVSGVEFGSRQSMIDGLVQSGIVVRRKSCPLILPSQA